MPVSTRRLWMPVEDAVVDGHARRLAAGEYRGISAASRSCAVDIRKLYETLRLSDPQHHMATRERPFGSIRRRMAARLEALGLRWAGMYLTPPEERVVDRYARELASGHYYDARLAARDCVEELARLAGTVSRVRPLTATAVQRRIYARARKFGRPWGHTKWNAKDSRTVERYARAVVAGEYATARLAATACSEELARSQGRKTSTRPFSAVLVKLGELARGMGLQKYPRWSIEEQRVVDDHLRALYAGRLRRMRPAAEACARELRRRFGGGGGTEDSNTAGRHSTGAVYDAMVHAAMRLGLPRFNGEATPAERRLYEKYARRVAAGRSRTCLEATRGCQAELRRMFSRIGKASPLGVTELAGHPAKTVHRGILEAAARLGLQFPGQRWLAAEERILENWLRWYDRHHHTRRLQPLRSAADGLSEDLAKAGFRRSACACKERLVATRRSRMGNPAVSK